MAKTGRSSRGKPKRTRDSTRRESIVRAVREDVVSGRLKPGAQLPTHTELRQRFDASPVTVQAALDDLADEGFVQAASRRGTFVSDRPPHLYRYGLVLPWRPSNEQFFRSRFFSALTNEATRTTQSAERTVQTFYDAEGHGLTEDYRQLLDAVRRHAVAGLVFATPPVRLVGTPVVDQPGVPRVVIMSSGEVPGMMTLRLDMDAFFRRAIEHLVARGRRRVAVVTVSSMDPKDVTRWLELARSQGLEAREQWAHGVHAGVTRWARPLVQLLLNRPVDDRPDALVIADDNLAEDATAGVAAAGLTAADPAIEAAGRGDLDVVVHCNHPWPPPTMVPVARLGFDMGHVLRTAIELIDATRRGGRAAAVTRVLPVFDHELPDGRPDNGPVARPD